MKIQLLTFGDFNEVQLIKILLPQRSATECCIDQFERIPNPMPNVLAISLSDVDHIYV